MKLGVPQDGNLNGHLFVSSGLGGMSGAQPKAAEIAGAAAIIAEVDASRIKTRYRQGWVQHVTADLKEAYTLAAEAMRLRKPLFHCLSRKCSRFAGACFESPYRY